MNGYALPRLLATPVTDALRVMPAVVVTGARQTGKSTLVKALAPAGDRLYLTLDDLDVMEQASSAPADLVGRAAKLTIDEIQREPGVLHAIKRAIDQRRTRGRFLLTGSANLLLMRNVSESLAGRASYLTLWPMTRREQLGLGREGIWNELIAAPDDDWADVVRELRAAAEDWKALARRGGYPTPALELQTSAERAIWFDGYVRTYLERDLQEISSVTALSDLRRLMRAACLRIGQMLNQTELGRDVALPQPTVHRYLNLLETSYQLVRIPAYAVNRTKRLIKTPKLYWADTGLAMHLAGQGEADGPQLENLVLGDLLAWRDSKTRPAEILYWRTTTGEEVDFVLEIDRRVIPIEVKATANPRVGDARHLQSFRQEYKARARPGLLLHTGAQVEWLAPGILAVPWCQVL